MNGKPGESGLSATMATRPMSSGRPRLRSAKLTQSIEARSATPSATAATLASCEPVTIVAPKKGAPRATGAIAARNRFMPVLLSCALSAAVAPRNSLKLRRGSRARRMMKLRCEAPSQPGNAYSGVAINVTASLRPLT